MTSLPHEAEYPMEPFQCLPTFQIGYFADLEQFKVDIHFANFGQVEIDPICSFLLTWDRSHLFY